MNSQLGDVSGNGNGTSTAYQDAKQNFGPAFTTHARSSDQNLNGTENMDLAAQTPMTTQGNYDYLQGVSQRTNAETGGQNWTADIGMYQLGGDPNAAKTLANQEFAAGQAAQGRGGVALDQSQITPWQMGMGSQAQQLGALGQQGAGYGLVGQQGQAQIGAGNALMALGQQAPGPSAAVLAMQQQGQANIAGQAALAAGARGGNTGLALQNAAQNQAAMGGALTQQLGVQRAQEDLANRQFQAGAIGQAANIYGNAGQTFAGQNAQQQNALAGAAGVYGQGAQLNAGLAGQNAALEAQQRQLNDQTGIARSQLGYGVLGQQLAANQNFDQSRTKNATDIYGIQKGTQYHGTSMGERVGGAVLQAGGGALTAMLSDMRAKKDIRPAEEDVSQAFRGGAPISASAARTTSMPGGSRHIDFGDGSSTTSTPWVGGQHGGPAPYPMLSPRTPLTHGTYFDTPTGMSSGAGEFAPQGMPAPAPVASYAFGAPNPAMARDTSEYTSDIRAKRDIRPAAGDVSQAFRTAGKTAATLRGTDVTYPTIAGNDYRAVTPGNIDLAHRPYVTNPDGSYSTVRSMGANIDGREVLMPTVNDAGYIMSPDESIAQYQRTGRHMGIYRNARESDAAGQAIHEDQMRAPPEDTLFGLGHQMGARKQVAPTDLVFSGDNGGTFRSPEDQYAYQFGVKNPAPDQQLADFRRAHVDESTHPLNAPGYAYQYKNPQQMGAAPGVKYGPMAQDLEKTPAGASVVGMDKSGKKFVDPGRLSLLTASEVSKQRKELDALNATIASIGQSSVAYPTPQAPQPYAFGSR